MQLAVFFLVMAVAASTVLASPVNQNVDQAVGRGSKSDFDLAYQAGDLESWQQGMEANGRKKRQAVVFGPPSVSWGFGAYPAGYYGGYYGYRPHYYSDYGRYYNRCPPGRGCRW